MDAIKKSSFFFVLFCSVAIMGQEEKSSFPKDTIYLMFDHTAQNKKIQNWEYKEKKGILFNAKDESGIYMLFYPYKNRVDTLPISKLDCYPITRTLKEIKRKKIDWINRKFAGSKYKPYGGSKNPVFYTCLIEIVSNEKFVMYHVIWRNEGITGF